MSLSTVTKSWFKTIPFELFSPLTDPRR